ncbi:MAG: hypothetical protein Q8N39_08130 [Pelolinea sp.]|nr:hypothetical protein [Pelolinea sp.]
MEKRKLEADAKLILILFGFNPLDWCRRDNGELVVINPIGQKFVYSPEEISKLSDKALVKKESALPKPKADPKPKHKTVHPKVKLGA